MPSIIMGHVLTACSVGFILQSETFREFIKLLVIMICDVNYETCFLFETVFFGLFFFFFESLLRNFTTCPSVNQ